MSDYPMDYKLGTNVGRGEDPASLVNTDTFDDSYIDSVKSAVGYSMEIFNGDIIEKHYGTMLENERNRIKSFVKRVINSKDVKTIGQIIVEYNDTLKDKYYNHSNGEITLNSLI